MNISLLILFLLGSCLNPCLDVCGKVCRCHQLEEEYHICNESRRVLVVRLSVGHSLYDGPQEQQHHDGHVVAGRVELVSLEQAVETVAQCRGGHGGQARLADHGRYAVAQDGEDDGPAVGELEQLAVNQVLGREETLTQPGGSFYSYYYST